MTLAQELHHIAGEIALVAPDHAERSRACAVRVRKLEFAWDEVVQDAMESAELAERSNNVVVAFRGRVS